MVIPSICLDELDVPIIVGIGDIGKMARKDHFEQGSPITRQAVELILERSGYYGRFSDEKKKLLFLNQLEEIEQYMKENVGLGEEL